MDSTEIIRKKLKKIQERFNDEVTDKECRDINMILDFIDEENATFDSFIEPEYDKEECEPGIVSQIEGTT